MKTELEELAEVQAEIYSIFSNAKRILIFWVLDGKEMSVNDMAEFLKSSAQNTSQHLRLMKSKGILTARRAGQTIYYRIAENELGQYCKFIHKENLDRLSEEEIAMVIH